MNHRRSLILSSDTQNGNNKIQIVTQAELRKSTKPSNGKRLSFLTTLQKLAPEGTVLDSCSPLEVTENRLLLYEGHSSEGSLWNCRNSAYELL